ncbi:hypothetical protein R69619_00396 [Paraburkholderia nemoris]|uniref:hypothetical protein n=1 Tax=Paraburkholderia nemoris TaxID=2793076 RepID=UPI00190C5470|nr:hypothetical protein [Paraburkholderia nemoris]MBK3737661.1 hypothetical protein [Paraburkholderia aspalathi]CAE6694186.1 hypothetical protein R69619_00396 [Paraburkholderia nemoris]
MHSALDSITKEIVEAETLWEIELNGGVDKDRYRCIGCGEKVWPASYKADNVNRPYFHMRPPTVHVDCDAERQLEWINKGKKGRITPRDGQFPAHYPSRLVLRDPRRVIDTGTVNGAAPENTPEGGRRPRDPNARRTERPTSAGTIRPICRSFINFPYDRDRELRVDGIEGDTYLTVFKKLKWDTLRQIVAPKLFYAQLSWKAATETDDYLDVTLDAGEWGDDRKKPPLSPFRVRIDWRDWSKARRTVVAKEIDATRKEGPKDSAEKGYLFFIGTQDAGDLTLIHVSDSRLVCSLAADIQYPKY